MGRIKGKNVVFFKGNSNDILPLLKEGSFDFVYIDGDHAYSQFKKDFKNCLSLVKPGGILCGDDYEVHISKVNRAITEQKKEEDYIRDSNGTWYHPGITLAMSEREIPNLTVEEGFWYFKV